MASAFGHALVSIAFGTSFNKKIRSVKFWTLGIICSILPDADVVSFKLGIPYEAFWGHRGFTHSLLFALILGLIVTIIFYRRQILSWKGAAYILFFTVCTASHSILDAMTTGGLGVAFFSPWNNTRYFFSWRPIQVSPIGVDTFFGEWGIKVLKSEAIWIGIPSVIYMLFSFIIKKSGNSK